MRSKRLEFFLQRKIFVALLILIQLVFLVYILFSSSKSSDWIALVLPILSFFVALSVINKKDKDAYKLTWIFIILLFPVFGGFFYLLFTVQKRSRKTKKKFDIISEKTKHLFLLSGDCFDIACKNAPEHIAQIRYLQKYEGYPIYNNTRTKYLTPGEEKFKYLLESLHKAEHYIFLEYFIIKEGVMWDAILKILIEKAQKGVEIRVLYDDVGSLYLSDNYPQKLQKLGIKCIIFNKFKPFLTTTQNNRDHRKIAVIDGKIAFTGGVNIGDEYINVVERFGHWKDAAIMLEGEAVWSFTIIFLQMWELCSEIPEDYTVFYPWKQKNH